MKRQLQQLELAVKRAQGLANGLRLPGYKRVRVGDANQWAIAVCLKDALKEIKQLKGKL